MRADTVDLAAIFGQPVRYLVPMYQRPYVWNREAQWRPLWEDIETVLSRQLDDSPLNDAIPHFLGAVVLDQLLVPVGMVQARHVIDGQQRLTTLQLFIAAARSLAEEAGQVGPAAMLGKLLFNDDFLVKAPEDTFKVIPSTHDREAFMAVVAGTAEALRFEHHRMGQAYAYFRECLAGWAIGDFPDEIRARRFQILSTVLWKLLVVVAIDLDQRDNAQVIFETLNARGTALLAGDLIKNHIFQGAVQAHLDADGLYQRFWRDLDGEWWREEVLAGRNKRPRLDSFLGHWLTIKLRRDVVSHQLFTDFKRYLVDSGRSIPEVLADLRAYADVYRSFVTMQPDTPMERFLYRLDVSEAMTAMPAVLWLAGPEGIKDPAEQIDALRAIECWLVRRMIRKAETNGYSEIFVALIAQLGAAKPASARVVIDYLSGLEGERGYWPSDEQMRQTLREQPLYTTIQRARLRLILEAIEEDLRDGYSERDAVPRKLTIEHILPQAWETNWPLADPSDAVAVDRRDHLKHTLGNLTLVTRKLNPRMSNGPFAAKREALRKLSLLRLSADVRNAENWDEAAIEARSRDFADRLVRIWPGPGVLRRGRPRSEG